MKTLKITSPEALDAEVAHVVRLKIGHTKTTARMESEIATVQKRYAEELADGLAEIAEHEAAIHDYCAAHRADLFPEKKSREMASAVIGFEFTPPRVETANKKLKWADVVTRLLRLDWGRAYVSQPAPKPDKDALLKDRQALTPEQTTAAGIQFVQDEQFFIRPNAETADDTKRAN